MSIFDLKGNLMNDEDGLTVVIEQQKQKIEMKKQILLLMMLKENI